MVKETNNTAPYLHLQEFKSLYIKHDEGEEYFVDAGGKKFDVFRLIDGETNEVVDSYDCFEIIGCVRVDYERGVGLRIFPGFMCKEQKIYYDEFMHRIIGDKDYTKYD